MTPIRNYFFGVGGILLCLLFALDAYLPKAEPHRDFDIDRTGLKISAPDTGIAPDTGAVAISGGGPTQDEAEKTKADARTAPARALAKAEVTAPKKPQRTRVAHLQPAKRALPPAQVPWSSQWSSNWSSNATSNWSWRGPITDARRPNGSRQASKQPGGYPNKGGWDFNFARVGRNDSCWGC